LRTKAVFFGMGISRPTQTEYQQKNPFRRKKRTDLLWPPRIWSLGLDQPRSAHRRWPYFFMSHRAVNHDLQVF
jgi:hypothetical protein